MRDEFPNDFGGLGTLKGDFTKKMKSNLFESFEKSIKEKTKNQFYKVYKTRIFGSTIYSAIMFIGQDLIFVNFDVINNNKQLFKFSINDNFFINNNTISVIQGEQENIFPFVLPDNICLVDEIFYFINKKSNLKF